MFILEESMQDVQGSNPRPDVNNPEPPGIEAESNVDRTKSFIPTKTSRNQHFRVSVQQQKWLCFLSNKKTRFPKATEQVHNKIGSLS